MLLLKYSSSKLVLFVIFLRDASLFGRWVLIIYVIVKSRYHNPPVVLVFRVFGLKLLGRISTVVRGIVWDYNVSIAYNSTFTVKIEEIDGKVSALFIE